MRRLTPGWLHRSVLIVLVSCTFAYAAPEIKIGNDRAADTVTIENGSPIDLIVTIDPAGEPMPLEGLAVKVTLDPADAGQLGDPILPPPDGEGSYASAFEVRVPLIPAKDGPFTVTAAEVADAMTEPPTTTRAYFRGRCLQKFPNDVVAANWDSLVFDVGAEALRRVPADKRLTWRRHRVERGETLGHIARDYGTSVGDIAALNKLGDVHLIRPGDQLLIPMPAELADKARSLARMNVPLEKMAVLYRTKFCSLPFEQAFRRSDIPYHMMGGKGFFERMEILDLNCYLTAAVFELERESYTTVDPEDQDQLIIVDGSTTQGFELQFAGNVTRDWSISAGYSYLDGEVSRADGGGNEMLTSILKCSLAGVMVLKARRDETRANQLSAFVFTDRGLYRPGEKAQLAAVVKAAACCRPGVFSAVIAPVSGSTLQVPSPGTTSSSRVPLPSVSVPRCFTTP